jgi:hypothetical protein
MRKYVLAIIGLVLLCLVAALGTATASPDTITVDSTTDVLDAAGDCGDVDIGDLPGSDTKTSLREAICAANNNPGSDTIAFSIPVTDTGYQVSGITGTWTIPLASSLPILSVGGTIISGTTQGDLNPDGPEIELSGASMGSGHCLDIRSANNVVHGLVINRCPGGIIIMGTSATTNTVSGNYIGTDASGSTDLPNASNGVEIRGGAQGNVVGGDTPEERNVISGNGAYGVTIKDSDTMSNTVSGNYIGTDVTGALPGLGNGELGVAIYGGAQNNTVGGDTEGERNIISGNGNDGVRIEGSSTTGNTISGNFIGTVVSGTQALGNGSRGVRISGAPNNTIGGDTEGERNVISGNDVGVSILGSAAMSNTVSGNYIGTDASGSSDLGNVYNGVEIGSNAQNNTVGGQTALEGNVISGNGRTGVHIGGTGTNGNTVSLNYIGTDVTGTQDTGNDWYGVRVADNAQENRIGPGNLILGNGYDGVHIYGSLTISNTITENGIYDNDWDGIVLANSANGGILAPSIDSANCVFISGTAPANSTVEVFTGPDDEGKTYLATCSADGAENWSVTGPFTLDAYVTATATDAAGNTSEFSTAADGVCYPGFLPLTVKNY